VLNPSALGRGLALLCAALAALFAPNTYVGAGAVPVYDQQVLTALSLLDTSPATNQVRSVLYSNRVAVHFVSMAPSAYARYSVPRHVIEIDEQWQDVDPVTLAAVLAHEATHAQDAVSGYLATGGAPACIDSEVKAFRTSALFWADEYGRPGKPEPRNDLEVQMNAISQRQFGDPLGLEDLVRHTYVQQCAH
jgi:hypothetical protein